MIEESLGFRGVVNRYRWYLSSVLLMMMILLLPQFLPLWILAPCGTPVPPFTEPRDGLVGEAATAGLGSLRFNLEGDSA